MQTSNLKIVRYLLLSVGVISLALALAGEWQAMGALIVTIICLLPALWVALSTAYLSLKIFIATALITQIMTVPMFYIQSDRYAFGGYRPYGFLALDAVPILLLLGAFLLIVASMVKYFQRFVGHPGFWSGRSHHLVERGISDRFSISHGKSSIKPIIGVFLLIAISLPVKLWMFNMGIGIVGTQPPKLPYHLSGILYYLFGFIVPMGMGYLYIKSNRKSILIALLISIYAILIGFSSSSKAVLMLTIAPVVAFAWVDRRRIILSVSGLIAGLGVLFTAESRKIVHLTDGLTTSSFTDLGTIGTLSETLSRIEWTPEILWLFSSIAARFESFQSLLLASRFNADAVGGASSIFLKSINYSWADMGHDAMHIEYLGYTIPVGFYNVAASLNDWMMMATNRNIFMMLPFALYATTALILLEKSLWRASFKYRLTLPIAQAILFTATMAFFVVPGSLEIRTILSIIVLLRVLPTFGMPRISSPA